MLTAEGPICTLKDFVAVVFALSLTLIWKLNVPAAVGVPLIVPVAALRLKPGGREPVLRSQLYGGFPPLANNFCEYCAPTAPFGSWVPVVMLSAGVLIVRLKDLVAVAAALSLTFTVKLYVPPVDGVPDKLPVLESDRPVGNVPEANDQAYGGVPPVADNTCE